ncbi:type IV toxin-antitoxin system AbiEi family antitoxin domain-containing protein [Desulfamplus magnetovallimortis]|nr:type IV toxin-antitoxin system AbiEi family antitoxin domain-containing protein [Desulfamplus magnetovallimortis]
MKYTDLEIAVRQPIFSRQELSLLGFNIYDYQLSLWVKKGLLLRFKNGIYAFTRKIKNLKCEEIAYFIYQPSYISLESALSYYNFIPEMVYSQTSVTAKINRTFDNIFGRFIYRHIKKELFWGYQVISTEHGQFLMAEPEKAILDYLYLNITNIKTSDDFKAIRLNHEQIGQTLNKSKFTQYLNAFNMPRMKKWTLLCLQ